MGLDGPHETGVAGGPCHQPLLGGEAWPPQVQVSARPSAILVVRNVLTIAQAANFHSHHLREPDGAFQGATLPGGDSGPFGSRRAAGSCQTRTLNPAPKASPRPWSTSATATPNSALRRCAPARIFLPSPAQPPGIPSRSSDPVPGLVGPPYHRATEGAPRGRALRRMAADRAHTGTDTAERSNTHHLRRLEEREREGNCGKFVGDLGDRENWGVRGISDLKRTGLRSPVSSRGRCLEQRRPRVGAPGTGAKVSAGPRAAESGLTGGARDRPHPAPSRGPPGAGSEDQCGRRGGGSGRSPKCPPTKWLQARVRSVGRAAGWGQPVRSAQPRRLARGGRAAPAKIPGARRSKARREAEAFARRPREAGGVRREASWRGALGSAREEVSDEGAVAGQVVHPSQASEDARPPGLRAVGLGPGGGLGLSGVLG